MTFHRSYPRRTIEAEDIDSEILRYDEAVRDAQLELRRIQKQAESITTTDAGVLEAYVAMVADPTLSDQVHRGIRSELKCTEWATASAVEELAGKLAQAKDAYLRERSHDIAFVGERLLRALGVGADETHVPEATEPTVIVAHDLSPADTASMAHQAIVGIVTEKGTRTSHTAILARALQIPCVLGVPGAVAQIPTGTTVVVDGIRGEVHLGDDEAFLRDANERRLKFLEHVHNLEDAGQQPSLTSDDCAFTLRANIELPEEAQQARRLGAVGIGLYRTEFLYVDRASPPSEDQQFEVFRSVLEQMDGLPVVLRTFDIGGDKFASSFEVPREMNPMLGLRAVRLALHSPEVFLEHLRAMVRASAYGDVKIMVPMVATIKELRQVKGLVEVARDQVRQKGQRCAERIPVGVMIEVPSAAIMADVFAKEAEFLSLGTNDLVQYSLAIDRTSQALAYLASPFDPSIVRLIRHVVRAAEGAQKPVSICGAMASDPVAAVLLLGLGVREFSMESAAIPEIKAMLRRVSVAEARTLAEQALLSASADDVERLLRAALKGRIEDLLGTTARP